MNYVAQFFAGAFVCNCAPHSVCGLQGSSFPTPFAKPRGVGMSSPVVNFAWGYMNLILGLLLLSTWPVRVGRSASFLIFLLGAGALGLYLSIHFDKIRRNGAN
jgi:hypothetical protein